MKKLILVLLPLFLCCVSHVRDGQCVDPASITFSIASSAKTSTPNLRIGVMNRIMARDDNRGDMQGMPVPSTIANYYLTKSQTYTLTYEKAIEIQVDSDTKMYVGSDLTNYILLYAGVPRVYTVK